MRTDIQLSHTQALMEYSCIYIEKALLHVK